jgi:7-carboxy-7-deazaguanine synthase
MNEQKPQSQSLSGDGSLVVHSIFPTIQGEGPFAGSPAIFIRLAGCNLDCPLCDTEYTAKAVTYSLKQLKDAVAEFGPMPPRGRLIVITGGEPFRQNIGPAVRKLLAHGYKVQIETNGTLYSPGPWEDPSVTIVVSPKVPKINERIASYARAYKYVACANDIVEDGLPTAILGRWDGGLRVARPPSSYTGRIYLQPADVKNETLNKTNLDAVVASCLRHGHFLCLQLHKIVGVE